LVVLLLALAVVLALWTRESILHQRALRAIPIRIHVNGSRGKSSVTRLAAAALREHGIRTVAKVTGSKARLILPDGNEEPVIRLGTTPNICEQVGILDRARREKADAIVIECMAVRPDLQKTAEHHIVHATIGVVTNIRPDHLDVMGPTVDDVAIALSSTVPKGTVAVLGDNRYAGLFGRVARERGSTLKVGRPEEVPPQAMSGFRYLEHEENVATVLEITRTLNVPDDVALRGMYKAAPDVGVCSRWDLTHRDCRIEFHNIFAANDLESTITVWQKLGMGRSDGNGRSGAEKGPPEPGPEATTVALLNLRADRIDRSLQYAEAVEKGLLADHYVLIGGITGSVQRRFEDQIPGGRLWVLGNCPAREIFDTISGLGAPRARVGGVGNIGGIGHAVLDFVARGGEE
jgi:poly-gamma-glutamate synthase PgsB/CapB